MIAGAEMALEGFGGQQRTRREILFNLEINNSCAFTSRCGPRCYLNSLVKGLKQTALSETATLHAAREVLWAGHNIRHLAIPGKEPLQSANLLVAILKEYHSTPKAIRPANIGVITAAAALLQKHSTSLAEFPLDWLAVSLDTADSGLRVPQNSGPLLRNAIKLREIGGTKRIGVNTCFNDTNWRAAIEIGKYAAKNEVDQWTISPQLAPINSLMTPIVSGETIKKVANELVKASPDLPAAAAMELSYAQLPILADSHSSFRQQLWRWRIEIPLAENVRLIVRNPRPGFFLRLRYDGQLLSREDFRHVGLQAGSYGKYEQGKIATLLNKFSRAIQAKDESLLVP